ncbi:hypothetical protein PT2222_110346 [Paraburkholderia tropica]
MARLKNSLKIKNQTLQFNYIQYISTIGRLYKTTPLKSAIGLMAHARRWHFVIDWLRLTAVRPQTRRRCRKTASHSACFQPNKKGDLSCTRP